MTYRVKLGGWAKPGGRIGGRLLAGDVALRVELACYSVLKALICEIPNHILCFGFPKPVLAQCG
ncbi:hypothetical protein [Mycetohabitans sp. B46]|uniref:hypothetical protein n=1 Tax=Mycetohabitans sp. B46 TaxID=2772536 RepID=UPI00307E0556